MTIDYEASAAGDSYVATIRETGEKVADLRRSSVLGWVVRFPSLGFDRFPTLEGAKMAVAFKLAERS